MGILSSNTSLTRYQVNGQLSDPVVDTFVQHLAQHAIVEIDDEDSDKSIGWTTLEEPFNPEFIVSKIMMGVYFIFSFRIDKKTIPSKIINKQYRQQTLLKLKESGKEYLSRDEKKRIKEDIIHQLYIKIPATPNLFDIVWNYEKSILWFFSTQKSANEEFEAFFTKTFKLNLIRHFPYTAAQNILADSEKAVFDKLVPSFFTE